MAEMLPTADELLDLPSADELLGPEPAPRATAFLGDLLGASAVGRVLKAYGDGVTEYWGPSRLGLSDESEKVFRRYGLFRSTEESVMDGFKTFNEAMIRPAAAGLDAAVRGVTAIAGGFARASGQVATELGDDAGRRLERDLMMLFDTAGVVAGTSPAGIRTPRRASEPFARADTVPEAPRAALPPPGDFGILPDPVAARPPTPAPVIPRGARGPTDPFPRTTDAVDKAGNINMARIAAPEDVKQVIRELAEADDFAGARRGTMTLQDTQDLAEALGMVPDQLAARQLGQAFNAEQALAARNLLVQSADNVFELGRKVRNGQRTDGDLAAFQEAVTRHAAIQEQVAGLTAEAGRALSSFRIMAGAARDAEALAEIVRKAGGSDTIEDLAKMIGGMNSPQQISKFLMDSRKATTGEMLLEFWINGLLSGPQTHATNILSNTLTALWAVPETAVAAGIGKVRQAMAGQEIERVRFGEAGARLFGIMQGSQDGARAALKAYLTEEVAGTTKLEIQKPKAIPSARVTVLGREIEIGGKQVRIPGRLLQAEDAAFRAVAYRQELNAQAYRIAATEKLDGDAFAARVADLIESPTLAMRKAAEDNASYQTFNKELGRAGQALQTIANSHPAARVPLTFVRTPINIMKYAGERTPLGIFAERVRDNVKGKNGGVAQDTQIARIAVGSALMTAIAAMTLDGRVTGSGPKDPEQRAMLRMTGWQPYSVRIGDTWYSYQRMDPLALLVGTIADLTDGTRQMTEGEFKSNGEQLEKASALLLASVSNNLVDKTWTSGVSDLVEAINDRTEGQVFEKYVRNLAASAIPTGVAQAARVEDPYLRDARNLADALQARLPGLSTNVMPKRDVWGEPIRREGSAGPDVLSPFYQSAIKDDPVTAEMVRLKVFPAPLDRKMDGNELTPKQYDDYQRVAGRLAKMQLSQIVGQEGWTDLPEQLRQEVAKGVISRSRQSARTWLLMENPDLVQALVKKRMGTEPSPLK